MTKERLRETILKSVKELSGFNIHIWNQVGPGVQAALIERLCTYSSEERLRSRDVVLAACEAILSPEVEGADWNANSVTLHTGAVPAIPEIVKIRNAAIEIVFELFKQSKNDGQKRQAFGVLRRVGYTGGRAEPSDDLINLALSNATKVVEFLITEAKSLSYELMQTVEHEYFYDFRRAIDIANAPARANCHKPAKELSNAIIRLRDQFNSDPNFVKFKVLVGFESIFPQQWEATHEDEDADDYASLEKYRQSATTKLIETIDKDSEKDWFSLIERVAAVQSDDMATFPPFANFLAEFARTKPSVASRLMAQASDRLGGFFAPVLNGLRESGDAKAYNGQIEDILQKGKHLAALARHLRFAKSGPPELAGRILRRAIEVDQVGTVAECLIWAMEDGAKNLPAKETFFEPAIGFLNAKNEMWWVYAPWLPKQTAEFFDSISESQARLMMPAMIFAQRVDYRVERLMTAIARRYPQVIWDVFAERLVAPTDAIDGRYEAIPYQFHGLEKELSKNAKLAVEFGRAIFARDSHLFRFRGGRLLSAAFPSCPPQFADELARLAIESTPEDAKFILAILENYHGEETTHETLKRLIARFPEDQNIRSAVFVSLDNTGVVWGENGFAEALRTKMKIPRQWFHDARAEVRAFAQRHLQSLEVRIADEQRRADERKALRELEFDPVEEARSSDDTSPPENGA